MISNATNTMKSWKKHFALAATSALALSLAASPASATSPVGRSLNLGAGVFELGLGAGIGHREPVDYTGLGLNFELGYGITPVLELRIRSGLRFGTAGEVTDADRYGRPVETETYNLGDGAIANPEIGLRFNLVRGGTAEIALDGKIYLPVDGDFGILIGVPLALHLGSRLRLDTGMFVPIVLANETYNEVSIPLHLWIKLQGGSFVGPMTGVIFPSHGGKRVPFGIGAGTALSYDADLRFWLLFEDVSHDGGGKNLGAGAGLYVTF
jgi:hypothetical protein